LHQLPKWAKTFTVPWILRQLLTVEVGQTRAGYELLSTDGMEGIKVERLARNLALNKSGFYHYFKAMDVFVKSLLRHMT
jgi:hypothetical protein